MKRTRESTSIHYRRLVIRVAPAGLAAGAVLVQCPGCGTQLEAVHAAGVLTVRLAENEPLNDPVADLAACSTPNSTHYESKKGGKP